MAKMQQNDDLLSVPKIPSPTNKSGQLRNKADHSIGDVGSPSMASNALAKICFYQGKALLARNDIDGAIAQFREAINYDNNDPSFYYQLALALAKDGGKRAEARGMLQKAIELNRDNPDYHAQLGLIYKEEGELYKAIGAFTLALNLDPTHAIAERELAGLKKAETIQSDKERESTRQPTPRIEAAAKTSIPDMPKSLDEKPPATRESVKTIAAKGSQDTSWLLIEDDPVKMPSRIRPVDIFILVVVVALAILALTLSHKASRVEIEPILPQDQATLDYSHLEFRWASSADNVDYLLQIEEDGQKVLEHYTRENMYVLSREDMRELKPKHQYLWRVIPISPKREQINYVTHDSEFHIQN